MQLAHESHPLIAERFSISVSSVEKISRKLRYGQSLEPAQRPGRSKVLGDKHLEFIRKEIGHTPYATSYELTQRFNKKFAKTRVHRSTVLRAMHELGFSFKKKRPTLPNAIDQK